MRVPWYLLIVLCRVHRALAEVEVQMLKTDMFLFHKTSYLNQEVDCTEPSPSVRVPWYLLIVLSRVHRALAEGEVQMLKQICFFFTKQAILIRRLTVLSLPLQ